VHVLVAGDGPEHSALAAQVARDGLPVSLLGFQADVRPVLAACDVWLTTTRREGLSISLLEAMAAGCPVIASAIPPNAEVVRDGVDGTLVPLDAPEALRDALLQLAGDRERAARLGASAAARVRAAYSLERMFEETWALYEPDGAMMRGASTPTALASSR
jgi:glycosyltransferase involved in cell wall biosynthesis